VTSTHHKIILHLELSERTGMMEVNMWQWNIKRMEGRERMRYQRSHGTLNYRRADNSRLVSFTVSARE
jgi:hypothetical protein